MKRSILIVAALIYLVSPLDLIPDFLLPFGFLDDAVVLLMLIRQILSIFGERKGGVTRQSKYFDESEVIEGEIVG